MKIFCPYCGWKIDMPPSEESWIECEYCSTVFKLRHYRGEVEKCF